MFQWLFGANYKSRAMYSWQRLLYPECIKNQGKGNCFSMSHLFRNNYPTAEKIHLKFIY